MRLIAVASGAIALLTLAGGPPARAADLGYGEPSDRYRSAYEDHRYRDLYGPPPGKFSHRYVEKEEIEENYAVDDDDYEERRLVPRRTYRYSDRYAYDCTPRHVIRDRLFRQGWQDFEEIDVRRDVATRAQHPLRLRPALSTEDRPLHRRCGIRPSACPGARRAVRLWAAALLRPLLPLGSRFEHKSTSPAEATLLPHFFAWDYTR